jgi:hypothetical protein
MDARRVSSADIERMRCMLRYEPRNSRIIGNVTLEQVAEMYEWAGIRNMAVFPWYEDYKLVALVTGWTEWGAFGFHGEHVGFLEHFIIKPSARRKMEIMTLLPSYINDVCRERGVTRLVLCIHHNHPKQARLAKWAKFSGYTRYGTNDFADWYTLSLKEPPDGQEFPRPEDPAGSTNADHD